jgi:proton glutamate symport protein
MPPPAHRPGMSLTTRMLLALIGGLVTGIVATTVDDAGASALVSVTDPVGSIWVNALRMTLIPLVVSLLIGVIASVPNARSTGRLGIRALVVFVIFLVATGVVSILIGPALVAMLPIDAATTAALQTTDAATIASNAARMPTIGQTLIDIVPSNPIRAAADGAMLPLVVFSIALGAAATRVPAEERAVLVQFFRSLSDAMLVIVGWVIAVAPIGVFALAVGLGARIGLTAVGVIGGYVVILSGVVILATILMYGAAVFGGGVSLSHFARAVAPGQAVAFSARSSLAALPALLEGARRWLVLPPLVTSFVLPLAVSTLRLSTPIMWSITLPFLARLYGVDLGYAHLALLVGNGILLSFSVPGLPSASLFLMAPFLAGLGIPVEALGIVIAADAIPDLFKGVLNVSGHMASATIVARHAPAEVVTEGPPLVTSVRSVL